ncbi:unnamed protein product [Pedinophyceae sp. YPF-701]|nr:unnamed protein product [Pedinophyceae sp. YPF-701]
MSDDALLPKATVQKMVKAALPEGMRLSGDFMAPLLACAEEMIQFVGGQAQEACANAKKSLITPEHVVQALRDLNMEDLVPFAEETARELLEESKAVKRDKKAKKKNKLTDEELIKAQEEMFRAVHERQRAAGLDPSALMIAAAQPSAPAPQQDEGSDLSI